MFEISPMNKYIVIDPIKDDEKIAGGLLFAPGNLQEKQHKMGRIVSISSCEETKGLTPGQTVLYDSIGSVTHRVGNQSFTTVKAINVVALVTPKENG